MDMKNQLNQMMEALKQKENIILQNNQKLINPQQPINNFSNNQGVHSDLINNAQMNPQMFNNNGMNFNQMNNQLPGFNPFIQPSGPDSYPQIPNNSNMIPNNFINNQIGAIHNQPLPNKNNLHPTTISDVL